MVKLSIITAVHNGLSMNRLFWKALSENTQTPFELVIIDNHSTDGSECFFERLSEGTKNSHQEVVYIKNPCNQSYPQSQIQGMEKARYDVLCFLNNDIWMPAGWEKPFLNALSSNTKLVLSPSGQEAQPNQAASDQLKKKWKRVTQLSKMWAFLFRKTEEERLWKSLSWMYGDLENFVSPTQGVASSMPGIKGDSVIVHRDIEKHLGGLWDVEVPASDWHLYLKAASLHEKNPEFPLPQVLLNSYIHHFGRYSSRQTYEPIKNPIPAKSIEEVWGQDTVRRLWWGFNLPDS